MHREQQFSTLVSGTMSRLAALAPVKIMPTKTQLCLICLSVMLLGELCFAQPALTISTNAGPPTTSLQVSGKHFPAHAAVDIYFGTTDLALAAADRRGSFGISIRVPASAPPGINWITGVARVTGRAAQASFSVQTDWAQFHSSASRSGLNPYENVLSRTTAGNLGLRWRYFAGSLGVASSPAVANGMVYAGSDDGSVYALNASTGALLWQFTTGNTVESSPAVANGMVYVGSDDFNVYALNASTGAKLWQFTTGNVVESSPAVANGLVYIGSDDSKVYAFSQTEP